jgi:hypothetical protein
MIARRRLLATTLAAAAAAGIPLRAAAQPGGPPADPDGTVPAPLVARGGPVPFLVSVVLVAVGLYVRLRIAETPVFRELVERRERSTAPMKSGLGLLRVVCGLALPETRDRSLRVPTTRPMLAEG